jgi:hypothetical protein
LDDDDLEGTEERQPRDWLHSDGGLHMMKRVLVGLYKQRTLHTLAEKVWPDDMKAFKMQVRCWLKDPAFNQASVTCTSRNR